MATKTAKPAEAEPEKPAKAATSEKPAKAVKSTKSAKDSGEAAPPAKRTNAGLSKPLQPSKELGAIVGHDPLARTEVISKVWEYIRKHDLQNPKDKREILADKKLHAVFGKDKATMFEMNKLLSGHLK